MNREANAPLVSIICATFNRSNVLALAIKSVLWQTCTDWELWIIGDACTDMKSTGDPSSDFTPEQGLLDGSVKARQSVTADCKFHQELIIGVRVKEVQNVPKDNGLLTEVFIRDWELGEKTVDQGVPGRAFRALHLCLARTSVYNRSHLRQPGPDQVGSI